MITPLKKTPKQPQINSGQWLNAQTPAPEWVGYPTVLSLPLNLQWTSTRAVPVVGARVHIYFNRFGSATVRAYFHAEGYLGLICEPDELPEWFKEQNPGVTLVHVFGREIDRSRRPRPHAQDTAAAAEAFDVDESFDKAHEANGNDLTINRPDDWIPEYPDQAQVDDDNQDD